MKPFSSVLSLYDGAIGQAEQILGRCNGTIAASQEDTILAFEKLIEWLETLDVRLANGEAMIRLARLSRRDYIRGERWSVVYDFMRRIIRPLKIARAEAAAGGAAAAASSPKPPHDTPKSDRTSSRS